MLVMGMVCGIIEMMEPGIVTVSLVGQALTAVTTVRGKIAVITAIGMVIFAHAMRAGKVPIVLAVNLETSVTIMAIGVMLVAVPSAFVM